MVKTRRSRLLQEMTPQFHLRPISCCAALMCTQLYSEHILFPSGASSNFNASLEPPKWITNLRKCLNRWLFYRALHFVRPEILKYYSSIKGLIIYFKLSLTISKRFNAKIESDCKKGIKGSCMAVKPTYATCQTDW